MNKSNNTPIRKVFHIFGFKLFDDNLFSRKKKHKKYAFLSNLHEAAPRHMKINSNDATIYLKLSAGGQKFNNQNFTFIVTA